VGVELLVLFGVLCVAYGMGRHAGDTPPPRAVDWMRVAKEAGVAGLAADSETSFGGTDGELRIRVEVLVEQGDLAAKVVIAGVAPEIGIERGGLGNRIMEAVGVRDLDVGDPDFDVELAVDSTRPLVARALLDAETRARVREAFRKFDAQTMRALLDLAHRLEPFNEPETPLARIVRADPLVTVRAAALRTLIESSPKHPRTLEAVRAAGKDADPSIRLRAALAQGEEGLPVLQALAVDAAVDDAIAAGAVAALETHFPLDAAVAAVGRAATGVRVRTGEAAVAALAGAGGPPAEQALVAALGASTPSLVEAAARALGRCGGVGAIPELSRAEARGGVTRRAAREAIALIQSRLEGATPGQVSLAGGEAGQVSVVESANGRVSLPPGD
jgi:hypothetical protein